ncbi:hypothetical protein GCM10023196_069560 [Actinoallomurus vinaceus]|uniref:Uncharacterized protein n=1 Tax=Actinoallomurus vinaceus TaxID=1080074 RepID=A0ABP8ULT8_9ACTN
MSKRLVSLSLAAGTALAALVLPAAGAGASVTSQASEANWTVHTNMVKKKLAEGRGFKALRTGPIYLKLTNTEGIEPLWLRLVTCDKRHVGFTDWRDSTWPPHMQKNKYYAMTLNQKPRTLKKGTCFTVQTKAFGMFVPKTIKGKVKDAKAL